MLFYYFSIIFACGFLLHQNLILAVKILPKHILYFRILCVGLLWYIFWIYLAIPLILEVSFLNKILIGSAEWIKATHSKIPGYEFNANLFFTSSAVALPFLFFTLFHFIIFRWKKNDPDKIFILYKKVLAKSENPMKMELLLYFKEKKLFLLTLKSKKIYICRLEFFPAVYADTTSISINPLLSGYRDNEERIEITTNYADINAASFAKKQDYPKVIVNFEEVISIQSFSLEDYDEHFPKQNPPPKSNASHDNELVER